MPIYTYHCTHCGIQFDQQQKFSDPHLTRCPECNKLSLQKVFQPVGIVFKGSGFYSTDHRSSSGTRVPSGKEKDKKEGGESKADKTSDSSSSASSEKE